MCMCSFRAGAELGAWVHLIAAMTLEKQAMTKKASLVVIFGCEDFGKMIQWGRMKDILGNAVFT